MSPPTEAFFNLPTPVIILIFSPTQSLVSFIVLSRYKFAAFIGQRWLDSGNFT